MSLALDLAYEATNAVNGHHRGSWRERLAAAVDAKARNNPSFSLRSVSLRAELGPGYLYGILREGKEPSVSNLQKICDVLQVSVTYIVAGVSLTRGQEKLAQIYLGLAPDDQLLFLRMAERFQQE